MHLKLYMFSTSVSRIVWTYSTLSPKAITQFTRVKLDSLSQSENTLEYSSFEYAIVTPWNPKVIKAYAIRDIHLEYARVFNHGHMDT